MRITVSSTLGDLERDLKRMTAAARPQMERIVERTADRGAKLAHDFAVVSAGAHGKHYPNAISAEPRGPLTWEYGPDSSRRQGGMSFEFGSRNQKPHLDLARSADIVGPEMHTAVQVMLDRLFWPGA